MPRKKWLRCRFRQRNWRSIGTSPYSHFTNASVYPDLALPDQPPCEGAIFSASGLTLLTPLGDSIDFFNTQTGTLRGRLLMPEPLPLGNTFADVIALDPNQQTISAISASGLTVLTLPSVVDQIAPVAWPHTARPSHFVPFASGAKVRPNFPPANRWTRSSK